MVDDGGCVVVVGRVIPSLRQDGRVPICRSISLINILQIELMKVLMKTGTSNVEKPERFQVVAPVYLLPPRCTSLVVWLFATIGPEFPSKSFFV